MNNWAFFKDGDAPIHFAARQGLLAAIQTLCAFGCNVDVANKQGLSPLHLSALHGHIEVVRYVDFRMGEGKLCSLVFWRKFKRCHLISPFYFICLNFPGACVLLDVILRLEMEME